jgi:hypothetical protein
MYGIFFEDINFAADGGIYAEKVKNRSFEFPDPADGVEACGGGRRARILRRATEAPPSPANTHYLRVVS